MAEPLYVIRRAVYAKIETTAGVDANPTAADAVLLRSVNPSPLNQQYAERNLVRGHYGKFARLPTGATVGLELELEAAGFGTAGPAAPTPGYDALLRCCGLTRTITADTKVDYAPTTPGSDSATVYFYQDGMLHKLLYARGTMRLAGKRNEIPVFRFTLTGLYGGVSDAAFPSPDTSAFVEPLPFVPPHVALSLHGIDSFGLESLEVDLGNDVQYRNLPNQTEAVRIVNRQSSASIELEGVRNAVYDWYAAVRSATKGGLALTHGTVAGNIVQLTAPSVMASEPKFTENQGLVHLQLSLDLLPTGTGNNELLLTIK